MVGAVVVVLTGGGPGPDPDRGRSPTWVVGTIGSILGWRRVSMSMSMSPWAGCGGRLVDGLDACWCTWVWV